MTAALEQIVNNNNTTHG